MLALTDIFKNIVHQEFSDTNKFLIQSKLTTSSAGSSSSSKLVNLELQNQALAR